MEKGQDGDKVKDEIGLRLTSALSTPSDGAAEGKARSRPLY